MLGLSLSLGLSSYGGASGPVVQGARAVVVGDSRANNSITGLGTILSTTSGSLGTFTGVNISTARLGIQNWCIQELGYPVQLVGQVTRGGHNSARFASDEALAAIDALNPDVVFLYCGVNDTGSVYSYDAIALGDPDADPASNAAVGAMPTAPGTGLLGTTLGNLHKIIAHCEANGVTVIAWDTPKTGSTRPAYIQKWLLDKESYYSNLIAFNGYALVAATPSEVQTPATATGNWTTAYDATQGIMTLSGDNLHPSEVAARIIGKAMAADPRIVAAFAPLPSKLMMPDGTNSASYINSSTAYLNNHAAYTSGVISGTLPSGLTAQISISGGTNTVGVGPVASGQGVRITLDRTGGSGTTAGYIRLFFNTNVTPVAGDVYVLECRYSIPSRSIQDIYGVAPYINVFETGWQDEAGTSISSSNWRGMVDSTQLAPKDGEADMYTQTVPLVITPNMVATATGTIPLASYLNISIPNNIDTATNGQLVVDILAFGLRKAA